MFFICFTVFKIVTIEKLYVRTQRDSKNQQFSPEFNNFIFITEMLFSVVYSM